MPYKSVQQMRFMHAQHPDIAARWDEEIRAKKKAGKYKKPPRGPIGKSGKGWWKPVAAGTAAGILANQVPPVQQVVREERKREKARKKGQIKKMLVPVHDDPYFNQEAAQQAFDLVMKMDDDTAEMFTYIVVSDLFETTVEKNLRTLQRHLDETIAKRLTDLKQAHLRLVAKGYDEEQAVAYAQTIALLEHQISKADPWNPKEHPRGGTNPGWFRTKVTHNQTRPIHEKTAEAVLGTKMPKKLDDETAAKFQDEYRQLADFLSAVNQSTGQGGDADVRLHWRDSAGRTFTTRHAGTRPDKAALLDPDTTLVGMEARPTALTAGGAVFGLSTALGGQLSPEQVKGINAADKGSGDFTNAWLNAGDEKASNARMYGRLSASGQFLQTVAPGTKVALAGRFADIIGSHGPEAEAVLGPTARKTAYRYRGTEKTPAPQLARAYGEAVQQGKRYGLEAEEEEELQRSSGRGVSHGSMVAAGARTRKVTPKAKGGTGAPLHAQAAARQALEERAPTWQERELGRQTVVQYLRNRMPQKSLYELQLASGNTPPSEGVIINADGQIASQAVGYGDDHYLPFNLKHLKALKGGEYIRTRSVGGLTAEDIYTGLIAGARQVTVTSRSGTYTVTFNPDFRGGRRYNDKARRMTRRYEQILDAVQSQQVDRIDIDPEMRDQITREVKEEYAGKTWARPSDIQDAIKERVDEFKQNPYITEQDEKRAEAIITARSHGASEKEKAKIRSDTYDDLMEQKEVKFRLNSLGYKAAQDALQEQFPYYISKPKWTPPRSAEQRIASESDKGYVEPGRNRPTAAKAGLYGTAQGKSGKFSAAQADYQGARAVARGGSATVGTAHVVEPEKTPEGGSPREVHEARAEKAALQEQEYKANELATGILEEANRRIPENEQKPYADVLAYTADDLKNPAKMKKFDAFAREYLGRAGPDGKPDDVRLRKWEQAIGFRNRQPFDRATSLTWPEQPNSFEGSEFRPGADADRVNRALDKLDSASKSGLVNPIPYSHMSDKEHQDEHRVLSRMHDLLSDSPGIPLNSSDLERLGIDQSAAGLKNQLTKDPDKIVDQIEHLQKTRTLVSNLPEDARRARQSGSPASTRTTITNPTPPAAGSPTAKAKDMAGAIKYLARANESDDPVAAKRVTDLADTLASEADAGLMTDPDWLEGFKTAHKQDWDALVAMETRSNPQRPITGSS